MPNLTTKFPLKISYFAGKSEKAMGSLQHQAKESICKGFTFVLLVFELPVLKIVLYLKRIETYNKTKKIYTAVYQS